MKGSFAFINTVVTLKIKQILEAVSILQERFYILWLGLWSGILSARSSDQRRPLQFLYICEGMGLLTDVLVRQTVHLWRTQRILQRSPRRNPLLSLQHSDTVLFCRRKFFTSVGDKMGNVVEGTTRSKLSPFQKEKLLHEFFVFFGEYLGHFYVVT